MSRRTAGVVLLFVAALLYATRYLAAAILSSSLHSQSADLFDAMLQYVGQELQTWSLVAGVAGLVYLIWAEVESIWRYYRLSDDDPRSNSK